MNKKGEANRGSRLVHVSTSDLAIKYLLRNQLREFQAAGYNVVGLSAPGENRAELEREPFVYECLPMNRRIDPVADFRALGQLTGYFARSRFDLVHTHTNKAGVLGCWAARQAGVRRIVSTVHGFYFHEDMNAVLRAAFIQLYRETFRFVDKVFMQSAEDVRTAVTYHITREDKIIHLGNGIDLRRFNPLESSLDQDAARLRDSIGVPDTATLVGIVARINHEKGYKELLKAIQRLVRSRNTVHLVAVGDGPAKSDFESLARQLGIDKYVHFVGFSENIPEWLTAMDIFVLPSYREGFPRTLCEAFAMGTPAVATRIRGCRELINDGDTGLLVEPRDEVSLCRALESLIDSASLRRRLSDRARKHAVANLNEQKIIQKIIRVYNELGIEPAPMKKQPCVRRAGGLFPLATDTESRGVEVS